MISNFLMEKKYFCPRKNLKNKQKLFHGKVAGKDHAQNTRKKMFDSLIEIRPKNQQFCIKKVSYFTFLNLTLFSLFPLCYVFE